MLLISLAPFSCVPRYSAFFLLPLSQTYTRTSAVLVDERDVRSSQGFFEKLREPKLILGAIQTAALLAGCLSRSERSDFNVAQFRRGSRKPPVEAHHRVTPLRLRQVKSIGEIHARPVQGLSGQRRILQSHAR